MSQKEQIIFGFKWPAVISYIIITSMMLLSMILLYYKKITTIYELMFMCILLVVISLSTCFITLVIYKAATKIKG